jgi:hypothetical protein
MAVLELSGLLFISSILFIAAAWIVLQRILKYRRFFGIRWIPRTIATSIIAGLY